MLSRAEWQIMIVWTFRPFILSDGDGDSCTSPMVTGGPYPDVVLKELAMSSEGGLGEDHREGGVGDVIGVRH